MTQYNGDLVKGLDSNNDQVIQQLTHQVGELQLEAFDLEDEGKSTDHIDQKIEEITSQIDSLRKSGR